MRGNLAKGVVLGCLCLHKPTYWKVFSTEYHPNEEIAPNPPKNTKYLFIVPLTPWSTSRSQRPPTRNFPPPTQSTQHTPPVRRNPHPWEVGCSVPRIKTTGAMSGHRRDGRAREAGRVVPHVHPSLADLETPDEHQIWDGDGDTPRVARRTTVATTTTRGDNGRPHRHHEGGADLDGQRHAGAGAPRVASRAGGASTGPTHRERGLATPTTRGNTPSASTSPASRGSAASSHRPRRRTPSGTPRQTHGAPGSHRGAASADRPQPPRRGATTPQQQQQPGTPAAPAVPSRLFVSPQVTRSPVTTRRRTPMGGAPRPQAGAGAGAGVEAAPAREARRHGAARRGTPTDDNGRERQRRHRHGSATRALPPGEGYGDDDTGGGGGSGLPRRNGATSGAGAAARGAGGR